MFRSLVFRRLYIPFLLVICAIAITLGVIGSHRLRVAHIQQTRSLLAATTLLAAELLADDLRTDNHAALRADVSRLAARLGYRVTVIGPDPQGTVLAESDHDPEAMAAHRTRPEVIMAFSTGDGWDIRTSATTNQPTLYHATRVDVDGHVAYIRLGIPLQSLQSNLNSFYIDLAIATLACMLVAALLAYFIARRQAAPIVEATRFADTVARGQLDHRILRNDTGELGVLERALNSMADTFSQLLARADSDRAELRGILASMSEGIIATDNAGKVLLVNAAAARLLEFDANAAVNRPIWELLRNDAILRATDDALAAPPPQPQPQPRQLITTLHAGRQAEVTLAPLARGAGAAPGLIIVVQDVTQAMRYQELRKEFVANVSHELRTPLTVIKGYVETLRDGAINDTDRRDTYLATIERHTNQLTNLVGDLLELSRLESQGALPRRTTVELGATVRRCVELLQPAATSRSLHLTLDIAPDTPAIPGNPDYLERAVINLLDNATKYTPAGGSITVRTRLAVPHAVIEITDTGIGIPPDDIDRIFERFYRVDRSRSREMGGTGLGLAIVKHIVQAHAGRVEVESTLNAGSTFRILLPTGQA